MLDNKKKVLGTIKKGAGKAMMVASLVGMVSMSVSAAGERELNQINKDVSITQYGLNLNAAGRIEYDADKNGTKDVFYDYQDYKKLGESLSTVDANEKALSDEYTRLYNVAEQNRKDLISAWNRFGLLRLGQDANYVTGSGTASIKGAIDSMPIHSFNEIGLSYDGASGRVDVSYPNPKEGVYNDGHINTATIESQIAAMMKHTESRSIEPGHRDIDLGENHHVRYVDASGVIDDAWNEGHRVGLIEGRNDIVGRIGGIEVWDGVATSNASDKSWDDAAGGQGNGVSVLCENQSPDETAKMAMDYVWETIDWNLPYADLFRNHDIGSDKHWKKDDHNGSTTHYTYRSSKTDGVVTYTAAITVNHNSEGDHQMAGGKQGWYHIGNVYMSISINTTGQ